MKSEVSEKGEVTLCVREYEGNDAYISEKRYATKHMRRVIYLEEIGFTPEGALKLNGEDRHTRDPPGLQEYLEAKFHKVWTGKYNADGAMIYDTLEVPPDRMGIILKTLARVANYVRWTLKMSWSG